MSPLERVHAAAGRLKVFPLPSLVLFPGTAVPLHIFELRYRAMVRDALASDSVFALAQVPAAALGELEGDPPLATTISVIRAPSAETNGGSSGGTAVGVGTAGGF